MIDIQSFCSNLNLELMNHVPQREMDIKVVDLNRPGMQFADFYEYFAYERLQAIGKVEMTYLESMTSPKRREVLTKYLSYNMPGIVICWGMHPPKELLELAQDRNIPVFVSPDETTRFTLQAINYLGKELAEHQDIHGVLVDVYGVGVLITGDSGVGKSEAALELIKRGHQLCADDVVDICRISEDRLIGQAPPTIRHFMEIRGIGLIDIRAMYGVGSVVLSKSIDMVIHLEKWDSKKEYERYDLDGETTTIMNVKIPYQVMPVRPGRNLAVIIEVAARNLSLRRMGYSAAKELEKRMLEQLANNNSQID